jgi:ATP-binding cassette subfamily B multidrug efflux pump
LRFFERLTKAFPEQSPKQPPNTLTGFCLYYTKGFIKPLLFLSVLSACIAVVEVTLFGFMGQLVDWLASHDPNTFIEKEKNTLIGMGILVLLIMPALVTLHSLVLHQSLLGNYPMSIRWLAHRYLLKQSVEFYQNDFAGRISAKVMQTALSIRESVMKILDVAVYISVYFTAMLFMVAQADLRLVIPLLVWLVAYIGIQVYFVPRLKKVSTEQADARSLMTGRIVDSYTNISTVKLFSHTDNERIFRDGLSPNAFCHRI